MKVRLFFGIFLLRQKFGANERQNTEKKLKTNTNQFGKMKEKMVVVYHDQLWGTIEPKGRRY